MKTYIIGRQEDCDIVIIDPTQMVSRHHAVLTVSGSKMTITDQSSNGTYINGIRIASGAPVPVTRKDVVSFGQAAELNWARIPDPSKKVLLFSIICAVVVLAIGFGGKMFYDSQKKSQKELVAKEQKDSTQLANLKTDIDALGKDCDFIVSRTDSLNKIVATIPAEIDKKVPSKEINALNRDFTKAETMLQEIKANEFKDNLISLRAAASYEKDPLELGKKVKEMQEKAESYKQIIKQVSAQLKDITDKLAKSPNKKIGNNGGQNHEKDKEKEKDVEPPIMQSNPLL